MEHGISNVASSWRTWPNRGIAWAHNHTGFRAQGLFYFTGPLTVWWRRRLRARAFASLVKSYKDEQWRVHAVGHSNGTAVILDGLRRAGWPRTETLHLVCGACDSDFERNGLNWALANGRVGRVFVYVAGRDRAMWWESLLLGRLLFGIRRRSRPLGLSGPTNVRPSFVNQQLSSANRVVRVDWNKFGHSTCWRAGNFERTMELVMDEIKRFELMKSHGFTSI